MKKTKFNHSNLYQETDIAAAALKMTAEREEVIDFIAPYYEQTGISIGEKCLFYIISCGLCSATNEYSITSKSKLIVFYINFSNS